MNPLQLHLRLLYKNMEVLACSAKQSKSSHHANLQSQSNVPTSSSDHQGYRATGYDLQDTTIVFEESSGQYYYPSHLIRWTHHQRLTLLVTPDHLLVLMPTNQRYGQTTSLSQTEQNRPAWIVSYTVRLQHLR